MIIRDRSQVLEVTQSENVEPNFTAINTFKEVMVDGLHGLGEECPRPIVPHVVVL